MYLPSAAMWGQNHDMERNFSSCHFHYPPRQQLPFQESARNDWYWHLPVHKTQNKMSVLAVTASFTSHKYFKFKIAKFSAWCAAERLSFIFGHSIELDGNRSSFWMLHFKETKRMENVQNKSNSYCYTGMSVIFKLNLSMHLLYASQRLVKKYRNNVSIYGGKFRLLKFTHCFWRLCLP